MQAALPQKSERSANGAEYESQGQARSEAERVAPGNRQSNVPALKGRNFLRISAFQASIWGTYGTQGDALRACPGLLYIAPLALSFRLLRQSRSGLDGDRYWVCCSLTRHFFSFTGDGKSRG